MERTVNWHFTPECDFKCKYCFRLQSKSRKFEQYREVLKKLQGYFSRINFAGGEPTRYKQLQPLVEEACSLGFECTIITNGFYLVHNADSLSWLFNKVSSIGISIDSLAQETNRKIGRCTSSEKTLLRGDYEKLCREIKEKGIRLKINTVVSKLNLHENFIEFYKGVQPDRIKLLQVLKPNQKGLPSYENLLITEEEFRCFVRRNNDETLKDLIVAENNEAMLNAYYVLDVDGCFLDNASGARSNSLLEKEISVPDALKTIRVDEQKYLARYNGTLSGVKNLV